jgi:large subunit ribosomal protein L4
MQVPVRDLTGKEVDTIDLNEAVFGVEMRPGAVHQALVRQRANARQGTHATKTRGEVSGSTRKPFAQKHTGRARAGHRRSPLWRHGGVVFGPHPRSYRQDMPRKMRRLAIRCMLSDKQQTGALIVLRDLDLAEGRTKELTSVLQALDIVESALVVTKEANANVTRSARNVGWVKTIPAALLNVGDLLKYRHLIITVGGVRTAEDIWTRSIDRKRGPAPEAPPEPEPEPEPAEQPKRRARRPKAQEAPVAEAAKEAAEAPSTVVETPAAETPEAETPPEPAQAMVEETPAVEETPSPDELPAAEAQKAPKPRGTRSRKKTP